MKDEILLIHFCLFYLFNSVYGGGRGSGNKKPKQKKSENKRMIKSRGGLKSFVRASLAPHLGFKTAKESLTPLGKTKENKLT